MNFLQRIIANYKAQKAIKAQYKKSINGLMSEDFEVQLERNNSFFAPYPKFAPKFQSFEFEGMRLTVKCKGENISFYINRSEMLISENIFLYEYGTLESQFQHLLKTQYSEREMSYKRKLQQAIKGAFMSELKAKRERELSIAIWIMEINKIGK